MRLGRPGSDRLSPIGVIQTIKIDNKPSLSNPVPQWSSVKSQFAEMQTSLFGDGPAAAPVREKAGAAPGSKTRVGTWIGMKKKLMLPGPSGTGNTNDNQLLALMENHLDHTAADLNTPDIKLEDFTFGGCPKETDHHGRPEVSSTSWDQGTDSCGNYSIDGELHTPLSCEADLFDCGPGELQAHHLEERVSFDFALGSDTDGGALQPCPVTTSGLPDCLATSLAVAPQTVATMGLSTTPFLGTNISNTALTSLGHDHFESDLGLDSSSVGEFSFPPGILELMDTVLPAGTVLSGPAKEDQAPSTQLDLQLVQEPVPAADLLTGALQESGLFPELEGLEAPSITGEIILDENSTVWSYEPNLQSPQYKRNFASLLSTPSPSVPPATVIQPAPWAPSRPQIPLQQFSTPVQEEAATAGRSPNRPRRTSRKPLRFEETVDHEAIASYGMEVDPPEEPLASTSGYTTTSGSGRRSRHSTENLTEKEKYHRIRSLNNEASKRCRQKRKVKVKDLAGEEKELMKRNAVLQEQQAAIERQRDKMKKLLNMLFMQAAKAKH